MRKPTYKKLKKFIFICRLAFSTTKYKAARVGQPSISVFNWNLLFAIAVHPTLVIVPAAVFFRCKACGLLENLDEVGLG